MKKKLTQLELDTAAYFDNMTESEARDERHHNSGKRSGCDLAARAVFTTIYFHEDVSACRACF